LPGSLSITIDTGRGGGAAGAAGRSGISARAEAAASKRAGRQLVQGQGDGAGRPRRQVQGRAAEGDLPGREPAQLRRRHVAQIGAAPARRRQQLVRRGHGLEPAGEGLEKGFDRRRLAGRLQGQRLDRGQNVLHPVIQFGDQGFPLSLGGLELGNVLADADDADNLAGGVGKRRAGRHYPGNPAIAWPDDPVFYLVRPAAPYAFVDCGPDFLQVVRVDELVDLVGAVQRRQAPRGAKHLGVLFADIKRVGDKIPVERAHARRPDGQLEPGLVRDSKGGLRHIGGRNGLTHPRHYSAPHGAKRR
jgi:hypothetical protein